MDSASEDEQKMVEEQVCGRGYRLSSGLGLMSLVGLSSVWCSRHPSCDRFQQLLENEALMGETPMATPSHPILSNSHPDDEIVAKSLTRRHCWRLMECRLSICY